MKTSLLLLVTLLFTNPGHTANVTIHADYREAANIFVIMDCVSGWWEKDFCQDDGAYQAEWEKRFGLNEADRDWFKKYDTIRKRYYRGVGAPKEDIGPHSDGIFSKKASMNEDMISPLFYSSRTLAEALGKLKGVVSEEDAVFLRTFYEAFEPKYRKLVEESAAFKKKAAKLNRKLANPKFATYFTKIARYYSVTEDLKYEVVFTWYPPLEKDFAVPINRFLVLQQNPIKHLEWEDDEVVFHEIVHTLSVRQPQKQKEDLSKIILEKCPIDAKFPAGQKGKIIEEPMAVVVGQILFLKEFFPERLIWDSKLYNNPWISAFAKNIAPVIEDEFKKGAILSAETAKKIGFLCNEMTQAGAIVSK